MKDTKLNNSAKVGFHQIGSMSILNQLLPRKVFFTTGKASHEDPLMSFELALRDAGIEKFNIVQVSSILPPSCEIIERDEGIKNLIPGQIIFCVMARKTSNEYGKTIYASIGVAVPNDPTKNGYLTEYYGYCNEDDDVGKLAEDSAIYMFKSAFNEDPAKSFSVTVKTKVEKDKYTTALAAAVLIL